MPIQVYSARIVLWLHDPQLLLPLINSWRIGATDSVQPILYSGCRQNQWIMLLTKSLLVQLDAILNAEQNPSLQEMKGKGLGKEKVTLTVSSGKEEKRNPARKDQSRNSADEQKEAFILTFSRI